MLWCHSFPWPLVSLLQCRREIPTRLDSHMDLGCSWRTTWCSFQLVLCTQRHGHLYFHWWLNVVQVAQSLCPGTDVWGISGFVFTKTLIISHASRIYLQEHCNFLSRHYWGTKPREATVNWRVWLSFQPLLQNRSCSISFFFRNLSKTRYLYKKQDSGAHVRASPGNVQVLCLPAHHLLRQLIMQPFGELQRKALWEAAPTKGSQTAPPQPSATEFDVV